MKLFGSKHGEPEGKETKKDKINVLPPWKQDNTYNNIILQ